MIARLCRVAAVMAGLAVATPVVAADIIVITHGQAQDAFWERVRKGVDLAAAQSGLEVDYRSPSDFDLFQMSQMINVAVQEKPKGLAVSVPDAQILGDAIRNAVSAGIPVVTLNTGLEASAELGALMHVGQDEFEAGRAAGEKLAELGGQKAICVNQEVGNVGQDLRCSGFAEGFDGDVSVLTTPFDSAATAAAVSATLEADPDIDTMLTLSASSGEAGLAAISALGRAGEVRLASFDLSPVLLQAIIDERVSFLVDQQQFLQGYLPVLFLSLYVKYGLMPAGNVPSGPEFITSENAAQVMLLGMIGIR